MGVVKLLLPDLEFLIQERQIFGAGLQRQVDHVELILLLLQHLVLPACVLKLPGQLLMQPSDDRASQDEEGPPDEDLKVQGEHRLARQIPYRLQKRLGPQVHVHQHHQEGEDGTQHSLRLIQVVAGQDDREKEEVQEGDLLRDEGIHQESRDESEQDKQPLEVLEQEGFAPFQRNAARGSWSDGLGSGRRGGQRRTRGNQRLGRAGFRRRCRFSWLHTI